MIKIVNLENKNIKIREFELTLLSLSKMMDISSNLKPSVSLG